jgi:uncharacterized protein (TIGR03435 family)
LPVKQLLLRIIALTVLAGGALFAQDITGTWQGTLHAGKDLRIVIKISTTDQGAMKGIMYSIDQGAQGMAANPATLQGSAVKISVPGIAGTYEGKLNADGNSIEGIWTQGPRPLSLNLTRATSDTAWAIPEPPAPPKLMAADASPVFEVATIKPSKPDSQGRLFRVNGRRFSTFNTSLSALITFAYGVHPRQITGGPTWLETEKYDLEAQPDGEGQPNDKQWRNMLQKLLADRFNLTFHREKRELSVYAIIVGKTGAKLTKSEGDPNGLPGLLFRGLGVLPARNATIADLADVMQRAVLDRPVVDQTGLSGRFDFQLRWTPDETQFGGLGVRPPSPAEDAEAPPDLFTAFQQQLGLQLKSVKAPVDVLVIDRIEKPSEN